MAIKATPVSARWRDSICTPLVHPTLQWNKNLCLQGAVAWFCIALTWLWLLIWLWQWLWLFAVAFDLDFEVPSRVRALSSGVKAGRFRRGCLSRRRVPEPPRFCEQRKEPAGRRGRVAFLLVTSLWRSKEKLRAPAPRVSKRCAAGANMALAFDLAFEVPSRVRALSSGVKAGRFRRGCLSRRRVPEPPRFYEQRKGPAGRRGRVAFLLVTSLWRSKEKLRAPPAPRVSKRCAAGANMALAFDLALAVALAFDLAFDLAFEVPPV